MMTFAPAAFALRAASRQTSEPREMKNHSQSASTDSSSVPGAGAAADPLRYTMLLPFVSRSLRTIESEVVWPGRTCMPCTSMPWRSKSRSTNLP